MGRHNQAMQRRGGVWFTRLRAVLAGALVLGVGGSLTLAAWTDSEYATGTFDASTFGIIGSNGGGFTEHDTSPTALSLPFSASAMSPNALFYAFIDIKTTAATTVAGNVSLVAVANTGTLAPFLTYRAAAISSATTCNSAALTGAVDTAYNVIPGALTTSLSAAGANVQRYCFEVRLQSTTPTTSQGGHATLTWQFTATSSS